MFAEKRSGVIIFFASALVLFPGLIYGQEGGQDQMVVNTPPVAQALVPEGEFAVQLAKDLKIGEAQNEAQAEDMLGAVGIEPKNGWIGEYPVTPDIIGEIQKSVAAAVDSRKVKMGKDEARRIVDNLVAKLGLNVTSAPSSPSAPAPPSVGPANTTIYQFTDKEGVVHFTDQYESIPKEYRNQVKTINGAARSPAPASAEPAAEMVIPQGNDFAPSPNPEVINNYYYSEGPPVVTYYAPPQPYYYLYTWVPYPFWSSGFFFSGFFILHDFHRHVFFHNRVCTVSNHFVHRGTRTVSWVDPANRIPKSGMINNQGRPSRPFTSPSAQAGARAIMGLNQQRTAPRTGIGPGRIGSSAFASGTKVQTPSSNQGATIHRITPSTMPVPAPGNPAGPVARGFRPSPSEMNLHGSWPNQIGPSGQRSRGGQPRTFISPPPSTRFFSQAPQTQAFNSTSVPQQGGFFRAPSSKFSSGGFHGGSSFGGHTSSSRGGSGGHR